VREPGEITIFSIIVETLTTQFIHSLIHLFIGSEHRQTGNKNTQNEKKKSSCYNTILVALQSCRAVITRVVLVTWCKRPPVSLVSALPSCSSVRLSVCLSVWNGGVLSSYGAL